MSVPNVGVNATVPGVWGDSITPSTGILARPTRGVYVGVTGHLVVRHTGSTQMSTYENVAGGGIFQVQVDMVLAHATTAATAGKLVGIG